MPASGPGSLATAQLSEHFGAVLIWQGGPSGDLPGRLAQPVGSTRVLDVQAQILVPGRVPEASLPQLRYLRHLGDVVDTRPGKATLLPFPEQSFHGLRRGPLPDDLPDVVDPLHGPAAVA